jgi:D-glycero-D-manno-heptose 1,7-bisphosphate phosphatase
MRTAILAGGQGTRMAALYPDLPKPMIPVAGKPVLQHQMELLKNSGIRDITLVVGYKSDVIQEYFGNGEAFGVQIKYIVEDKPLGTGGALSLLPRDETLVLFADVYFDIDISRFVRFHRELQASVTLFVHPNDHPMDSDIVVTGEGGNVLAWKSKKDADRGDLRNLVNAGLYVFSADALPVGDAVKRDLEHDLIMPILSRGKVFAYRSTEYVKDMGTPERLKAVNEAVTEDVERGVATARNFKNKQRAVFLDRDGTLNEERGFITSPEQISLIPGVARAVKALNISRFLTICVTNQPVIARGEADFAELDAIHARLDKLLGLEGAYLDDLLFCPHHPDGGYEGEVVEYKINCTCRKPKPGMLLSAAERYNIDLSRSYMIGDRTADIAAGKAAGCMTIGVKTGRAVNDGKYAVEADIICKDLSEAVDRLQASC